MSQPNMQNSAQSPQMSDEEKRGHSYHYFGYPELAKWMASSQDFFLLRRYSALTARSLLYLQHRIAKIEAALTALDEKSVTKPYGQAGMDSIDDDPEPLRKAWIEEVTPLLQQYYDLVNGFAQVRSIPTARPHHIRNLDNWFDTYPYAIVDSEQHFRHHEGDLFPVVARGKTIIQQFLEQWRWFRFRFALEGKAERNDRVDNPSTTYISNTKLEIFVSGLVVVAGLLLLFGPMWWLNFVSDNNYRLAIITVFVTAFAGCLFITAGQRPFEVLGATAAYAAVLLVYLQSNATNRAKS